MTLAVSTDPLWLRDAPRCRTDGSTVHVTLTLDPKRASRTAFIAWSAGGLQSSTPPIHGSSVTYSVPLGLFRHGSLMRLQMIGSTDYDQPVLPWTQIPVLEEAVFRAEMVGGQPVLSPLGAPVPAGARADLYVMD